MSSEHAGWAEALREAEILTDYAVTARYPGAEKVSKKDAELAVKIAGKEEKEIKGTVLFN